jgi:FMN-dependent NADH-azoreductase
MGTTGFIMNNILLITSSTGGEGAFSTRFATELAQALGRDGKGTITVRDLAIDPLPHVGSAYVQGRMAAAEARTPEQAAAIGLAQQLVDELTHADIVVIGAPMINFAPPTQLKAWFDHVLWPGVTVKFTEAGAKGLVTGKKVYLVTAAGGRYAEGPMAALDFQTGYLRHLLGFMGLTDVEHVRVEGVAYGPEAVQGAVRQASADIERIAALA